MKLNKTHPSKYGWGDIYSCMALRFFKDTAL